MKRLTIEVDESTWRRLEQLQKEDGRTPEERASALVTGALALPGVARDLWRAFKGLGSGGAAK